MKQHIWAASPNLQATQMRPSPSDINLLERMNDARPSNQDAGNKVSADKKPETSIQITPLQAPTEAKNAIRRQRKTSGIQYSMPPLPSPSERPSTRAAPPMAFQPGYGSRIITASPHALHGEKSAGGLGHMVVRINRAHAGSHNTNLTLTKVSKGTKGAPQTIDRLLNKHSASSVRDSGGVSLRSQRSFGLNGFHGVEPSVRFAPSETENLSRNFPPGLRTNEIPLAPPTNPFGFSRSLTFDHGERRFHDSAFVRQLIYNDDLGPCSHSWVREESVFIEPGRRAINHLEPVGTRMEGEEGGLHNSNSVGLSPFSKLHNRFLTSSSPAAALGASANRELGAELPNALTNGQLETDGGFTSMSLADSIIQAVREDTSEIFQLCQTKVKYSDFIENTQPHRLLGIERLSNQPPENKRLDVASPNHHHSTFPPLNFPKKSHLFPLLSPRTGFFASAIPPRDQKEVSIPIQYESDEAGRAVEMISIPEPQSNYDRPKNIIIESDSTTKNAARPILKQACKVNCNFAAGSSTAQSKTVDTNNNKPGQPIGAQGKDDASLSLSRLKPSDSPDANGVRDKGRIVRFNFDPKIHEFAPSEPVNSPK